MNKRLPHISWLTLSLLASAPASWAADGEALYTTYCASCHGADGNGAAGGAFPPLAGSEWVKGDPARGLNAVIKGLMGEIVVKDKAYNLVMPPQGDTLNDNQLADIFSYVRTSWGNKESAVTAEQVKAIRAGTAGQTDMWQADALLKKYPFPKKTTPGFLKNGFRSIYADVEAMPDFSQLEPESQGEDKSGFLSLDGIPKQKQHYAVVWEAELIVPEDGEYTFILRSDDSGRVIMNKKEVAIISGLGGLDRVNSGTVTLKKSANPIRVEYFQAKGGAGIILQWKGPGLKGSPFISKKPTKKPKPSAPPIILNHGDAGTARIYRHFIEGTTPRAYAVGYANDANLAFSLDHCAVELMWTGPLIDAGRHWTGRGQGATKPPGKKLSKINSRLPFAQLSDAKQSWPANEENQLIPKFLGMDLNQLGEPSMFYQVAEMNITDVVSPNKDGSLNRQLSISSNKAPAQNLYFSAADGLAVKKLNETSFQLGDHIQLDISSSAAGSATINGQSVVLPLELTKGTQTINLSYSWK
ncbi:c-type cytochrome [Persicirhabdus sediminis]|uniref:C-type cytochrome n=1 Tax=Persicirhabdus sediminis TaxID=454144 RepID=A0A8J7MEL8_9BACT|nr:c-type cytochrome [Persicirhabdus sediminis]MBK1792519.1 c-type cytochrome [Persicirhabdus sediminis]